MQLGWVGVTAENNLQSTSINKDSEEQIRLEN